MAYERSLWLRRTFTHPDGREVVVYEDTRTGTWTVELRPANPAANRQRWNVSSEQQAADIALGQIVGDDAEWRHERW